MYGFFFEVLAMIQLRIFIHLL